MRPDNKELARRFHDEVFNRGNLAYIDEAMSKDVVFHMQLPGGGEGRNAVWAAAEMLRDAFPDIQFEVVEQISEGDLVSEIVRITGTHLGDFDGLAPSGRRISVLALGVSRFRDGKYVEDWGLWDTATLQAQLSSIESPNGDDGIRLQEGVAARQREW
jgi:predicted ester cyclase